MSLSGLSENEAREFHRLFMVSFIVFTIIAIIAHFLVWSWQPWLQTAGVTDQIGVMTTNVLSHLT